jgi:hypothetical protein
VTASLPHDDADTGLDGIAQVKACIPVDAEERFVGLGLGMDGGYEYLQVFTHLFDIGFVGGDDETLILLSVCIEPLFGVVEDDLLEKL